MSERQSPNSQSQLQPHIEIAYLAETPEIIPILAKWHHEQWGYLIGATTLEQRKARLKHHLQRQAIPTTFAAWLDNRPIGSAALIANDLPELDEWTPWLANVFVLPEFRRNGIGAILVQRVAAEAANLGYPRLYLYTLDQMHLYESLDWQISHVRLHRGHEMTVMARDLVVHPPPVSVKPISMPITVTSSQPTHK